jgi:phage virion morphogenesis protein
MIEIDLDSAAVEAALAELERRVSDTAPVMSDITEYLLESTRKRFKDGGPAPDGTPWAPKSPVTLENYRRKGRGVNTKPLTHQGDLSLFGLHHDSGPDHAQIAASPVYAATMQFGARQGQFGRTKRNGPIPWGDIPARPFLGLSKEDERSVLSIIEGYLTDATR